jgi:zinc transporter, ZIP family
MVSIDLSTAGALLSYSMGLIVAIAFPLGAAFALFVKYPDKLRSNIAAFGSGIYLAVIAFSLVSESTKEGNGVTMGIGFIIGAVVFSFFNHELLKKFNLKKKIQKNNYESKEYVKNRVSANDDINHFIDNQNGSSSSTILIGTLLDSIPESLFLGVIIALDISNLFGATITLFLGNLSSTIEGAKRMFEEIIGSENIKEKRKIIIQQWMYVFLIVSIAAPLGYYLVKSLSHGQISIILGFAAGVLMAFITEDLIPEAYKKSNFYNGIATTFGFLIGFTLFNIFQ